VKEKTNETEGREGGEERSLRSFVHSTTTTTHNSRKNTCGNKQCQHLKPGRLHYKQDTFGQ